MTSRGYSLVVMERLLTVVASLGVGSRVHGLQQLSHEGSVVAACGR